MTQLHVFLLLCVTDALVVMNKASFSFRLDRMPYAKGVHLIHSPQQLYPSCNITEVLEPKYTERRSSISFACCNAFTRNEKMSVRMFATQPNESNLIFFKAGRAVYRVRLAVAPAKRFLSCELTVEVTNFAQGMLMAMTKPHLFCTAEDKHFQEYRRGVLRGHEGSDDFWIMAERVMDKYSR